MQQEVNCIGRKGGTMGDFIIQDCTLLTKTSGMFTAINLSELRDRLATCRQDVLYHHFRL